ncbi:CHASE2 domain-containing protein [Achromobacter xylosoxidans]
MAGASTWLLAAATLALTLLTYLPGAEAVFSPVDRIFRQFVAANASQGEPDHVSVIVIDKKTVDELGVAKCFAQSSHGEMLARLREAASVVIDMTMLCTEADGPVLAAAIERHGRIVLPVHVSPVTVETDIALFPAPLLMAAATAVGQRTIVVGSDHLIQGLLPYVRVPETERRLPHVALEAIRVAGKALPFANIEDFIHERVSSLGRLEQGVLSVTLPTRFNLKRYSYVDVLKGAMPDSVWRGKIVYIGDGVSDRAGIYNLSSSSAPEGRVRESEANAMMTEALLDGHILGKPPLAVKLSINAIVVGGTLLICLFLTGWRMYAVVAAWLALYVSISAVSLLQEAYWLPPGAVVVACGGVFALCGWRRAGRLRASLFQEYRQLQQQAGPAMLKAPGSPPQVGNDAGLGAAITPAGDGVSLVMKQIRGLQSGYIEMMETLPYAVFVEEHGNLAMCNERGRALLASLDPDAAMPAAPTAEGRQLPQLPDHPIVNQIREAVLEAKASGHMRSFELELHGRTHTIIVTPFSDGERYDSTASMTCVVDIHDVRAAVENDRVTLRHMVHDLRSPLATVLSLLEERLDAKSKADAGLFEDLHKLVDYSLRVAQDFTQLSRAGHLDSREFVPLEVNDIVADAVDGVWHAAQAKGITIDIVSADKEAYTRGNRDMLLRAMVNLLDNAIKYSPGATQVTVTVVAQAPWVDILFSDQGIGVSEEARERLFEPFFQVEATPHDASRGVGLGLPFVMAVARQHMGTVMVVSTPGSGSRFTLRLPQAQPGERV